MHSDKQVVDTNGSATSYSNFVEKKFKPGLDILNSLTVPRCELLHAAMGIAGEAGELLDAIKKHVIYDKPLDMQNVVEELGDLRFFMQAMQNLLFISDSEIIKHNVDKLSKRYKKGYSNEEAQQRADKQEVTEQTNAIVNAILKEGM